MLICVPGPTYYHNKTNIINQISYVIHLIKYIRSLMTWQKNINSNNIFSTRLVIFDCMTNFPIQIFPKNYISNYTYPKTKFLITFSQFIINVSIKLYLLYKLKKNMHFLLDSVRIYEYILYIYIIFLLFIYNNII